MVTRAELENDDDFVRGYHGIPHEDQLRQMSFVQLVSLLATCQKDSPKFAVIERELKKHLAKDQAEINRKNILIGGCIGGIFGLAGVVLGAYLKDSPSPQQVAPSATVRQLNNGQLTVKPPPTGISVPSSNPPVTQPTINPAPIKNNAQPSSRNP